MIGFPPRGSGVDDPDLPPLAVGPLEAGRDDGAEIEGEDEEEDARDGNL